MPRWVLRAAVTALVVVLSSGAQSSLAAQQPAPVPSGDASRSAGPRLPPVMRRVEPTLQERKEPGYAPLRRQGTTVISISTIGLIVILVLLIILLA